MSEVTKGVGFVHLHNHSHYSLLDGLQKVPEMLDRVKELGMDAVALTDHGNLSGAIEFYKEAKKRGIKPIIGLEAYVSPRKHTDKTGKADASPYHLILLVKNEQGYQNLMRLSSIAHLEGFYYKPRIDRDLIEKYHEGLICLSACLGGEVAASVMSGNMEQAAEVANWYHQTFGEGNYYLEMQDHEHESADQKTLNDGLVKLSKSTGIPLVLTADSHYCKPEDKQAHEILLCVQTGSMLDEPGRMSLADYSLHVSSPEEVAERWQGREEAMHNTVKIAQQCKITIELGRILIPKFEISTDETERDYLHDLAYKGLAWRYGGIAKEDISTITQQKTRELVESSLVERLEYELGVIAKMNYDGYFLIVADFINWGKNQGIIFGPGRGSAAGSIVAYALNITDLDPMKYDLMFERFLNPDRISMPDIDVDMQDTRRQEVIDYVVEKYGSERVAQIVTFGTMAARNAVRDTGRVLGMPYGEVDAIAKQIPAPVQGRHIPLAKSIKADPVLKKEYETNPRAKHLIDLAMTLEGTIRSNGVHAAGVVIAPDEIVNYVPVQRAQKGGIATQYSMVLVEELGLLKMDLLGLSNLTIIKNALRIVRKVYGQNLPVAEIPLDDVATFALLARGDTTGIFQLESSGMKRYLRELRPNRFEDIIAMVALYRPGPMAELPRYIAGKNDPAQVTYPHPSLEPILKGTYGVMVYQEQITTLLQLIAGYTPGQADLVRKAIGKKKRDIMKAEEPKFIAGCIRQGLSPVQAASLWAMIQPFADYSFNKAHAACYGMIAYQTAYLKAHYPAAFMAALMTSNYDNIEKIGIDVSECRHMGITVQPPDVNLSFLEFGVIGDTIRFGLSAVKNIGTGAIEAILAARDQGGPFDSVEDFAKRVNVGEVNKKTWESLIKCGAFDTLADRNQLLFNLDSIVSYAQKAQKNALSGQIDIFGSMGAEEQLPGMRLEVPPTAMSRQEKLAWEKELLGLYLSEHPLDSYAGYLRKHVQAIEEVTTDMEGRSVKVGGIITSARKITTRNGEPMAFVAIEDKTGSLELIVFPKLYAKNPDAWLVDSVIGATGKVNTKDRDGRPSGEIKVLADTVELISFDTAEAYQSSQESVPTSQEPQTAEKPPGASDLPSSDVVITLDDLSDTELLMKLRDILKQNKGSSQAFVKLSGDQPKTIKLPFAVTPSDELIEQLGDLVGAESVQVKDHTLGVKGSG